VSIAASSFCDTSAVRTSADPDRRPGLERSADCVTRWSRPSSDSYSVAPHVLLEPPMTVAPTLEVDTHSLCPEREKQGSARAPSEFARDGKPRFAAVQDGNQHRKPGDSWNLSTAARSALRGKCQLRAGNHENDLSDCCKSHYTNRHGRANGPAGGPRS
jgi:hypothetical protein